MAAILEAAQTRLRPVLMTSAASVCGHYPLVLVTGPGAEARNSIGIVLVAGMAIGTVFTLFVVPAPYLILAAEHHHTESDSDEEEAATEKLAPARAPAAPAEREKPTKGRARQKASLAAEASES